MKRMMKIALIVSLVVLLTTVFNIVIVATDNVHSLVSFAVYGLGFLCGLFLLLIFLKKAAK